MPFMRIVEADEHSETTLPPTGARIAGMERWVRMRRGIIATAGALLGAPILVAHASPAGPIPQENRGTAIQPTKSGFAEVNGFRLYHEIFGEGEPVVVLHGGLMTIPEMSSLVQPLARGRRVIAVELQGHGHSADTDRPLRVQTMGDDVGALIEHLGLGKADVVGFSLGGHVALRAAIQHPDRVRRLVLLSIPFAPSGWFPEVQAGMSQVGSKMAEMLKGMPTAIAARAWPQPERFPKFLDKLGAMMAEDYDWSAEVRRLPMPVMLVYADHDAISTRHIAEFYGLLGGGLKDPGFLNPQLTRARLSIVPGYTHYNLHTAPELGPIVESFLSDARTNPGGGETPSKSAK